MAAEGGGIGIAFVPVPCVLVDDDSFLDGPKPLYDCQ
jgi:hypothetical protein